MKASDIFIKVLENHGVDTIFGVPGEENLDFINSMKDSSIKLILTRNEQTAVFMAATHGRLTGKIGVAIATLGPGATNMMTGVAYAQLGGMPVMVITGQKPIKKSKQGLFQIVDVVGMMTPLTQYSKTIISAHMLPYMVNTAIKIAEEEKPGAVHIELPEDIAAEEIEIKSEDIPRIPYSRRPEIDEKMLKTLVSKIEKSKTPVILMGSAANRKRVTKYITKFIVKHNIPYFASQMGKGVVDGCENQYLGTAALTENDYIHDILDQSDLIISVGYDSVEKPTQVISDGRTEVVHINFVNTSMDSVYSPSLEVIGDIGNTFWRLEESDINTSNWDFEEIYAMRKVNKKKLMGNISLEDNIEIMMPRRLVNDVRECMGEEDILTLDNGLYKVWFARNYPAYTPNTILLDNALATMGAGFPSAMEAKRLNPDKKVVCVTGDGGLVMNLGDLETLVRLKLDIVVVVLNNYNYGMIKWKQEGSGFDDYGLDFGNPNFVQLAQSFGGTGFKVEHKNDFKKTLKKSLNKKGLVIIDLDFDYPQDIK
ncbi:acetolactate synthase large subunit [Candidatus Gracilibacteria bacterium]|nr:acetolactate synthase large subunit [Candidatus Gracilibacteria bacterium]